MDSYFIDGIMHTNHRIVSLEKGKHCPVVGNCEAARTLGHIDLLI